MAGSKVGGHSMRRWLLAGAALSLVLGSGARAAETAADGAEGAGLEEVVVTAEKRETNLQKTPSPFR